MIASTTLLISPDAIAQEKPTLSGTWSAGGMSERWNIGDWGEACGPKPAPKGAGGGTVTISDSGSDLSISGGGYPSTRGCFEMGGGIGLVSHSGGARFWRSVCSTSSGDPRKARIVTTIQATDTQISFDETGEYQFILKEQNCTASVRRNRTYSLIKRAGEDAPAPTASEVVSAAPTTAPAPATAPTMTTAGACDSPGDPAKLEVRPAKKAMRPGESYTFRVAVMDAAGCMIQASPQWSVRDGSQGVSVTQTGAVTVADGAAEGETQLTVGIRGKSVNVSVQVVSAAAYSELLRASGLNASGESNEAASTVIATGGIGGDSTQAETAGQARRKVFFGVAGGGVLVLAGLGLVLWRRGKRQAPEVIETVELVPVEPLTRVVQKTRVVARPKAASSVANPDIGAATANGGVGGGGVLAIPPGTEFGCSRCGWRTSAGPGFCPNDGSALLAVLPLASGAAPARAPAQQPGGAPGNAPISAATQGISPVGAQMVARKVCPVCGTTYGLEAALCAKEGASLIAINVR